ncbi:hypothetical protein IKG13_01885 [Candidatus Saccharibacteria bacterium]|nr:hypothetical protein [Candidatus Saccharibacteria bacterium]MBR3378492.1 hypothetical protein [Candidatus Saccharibacteria bacterium]
MIINTLLTLIAAGNTTKGSSAADRANQAKDGLDKVNGGGSSDDLEGNIGLIINAIIGFVAIIAVIVIIIGGINYTMSQGDPQKTKKAKDTILYGVIGLIISLLAFAIVNFVLNALQG